MALYVCSKCGKEFNQKSHYKQHNNRKYPCIKENNLKRMVEDLIKKYFIKNNIICNPNPDFSEEDINENDTNEENNEINNTNEENNTNNKSSTISTKSKVTINFS